MGRGCLAEEAVGLYFDSLVRNRVAAEVGLLIGKPAVGSKDLLLSTVSTPANESITPIVVSGASSSAAPSTSKGSKKGAAAPSAVSSGVTVQLEQEWIAEHALQIVRMLPGGLAVLGLYVFCSDSAYQAGLNQLCAVLAALWDVSPPVSESDGKAGELFLLHVDAASKKQSLRSSSQQASASSLKPCELKYGPAMNSVVCIQTALTVTLALPWPSKALQLKQALTELVSAEAARIRAGVLAFNNAVPNASASVLDVLPSTSGNSSAGTALPAYTVQVCCPVSTPGPATTSTSTSECKGLTTLSGVVFGVAYVHKREPFSRAASELQADLATSLQARADVFCEDVLRWTEEQKAGSRTNASTSNGGSGATGASSGSSSKPGGGAGASSDALTHPLLRTGPLDKLQSFSLPRRVLLPWTGGIKVCDYLLEGEAPDAALERFQELWSAPGPSSTAAETTETTSLVEQVEPPSLIRTTSLRAWDPTSPDGGAAAAAAAAMAKAAGVGKAISGSGGGSKSGAGVTSSCVVAVAGGVAIAAIAAGIGYLTL